MLILNCPESNSIYEYTHFRLGASQAAVSMKVCSSLLLSWYVMAIFTMCIFISNNSLYFRLEVLGLFLFCFLLFWNEGNKTDEMGLYKNRRSQSL